MYCFVRVENGLFVRAVGGIERIFLEDMFVGGFVWRICYWCTFYSIIIIISINIINGQSQFLD